MTQERPVRDFELTDETALNYWSGITKISLAVGMLVIVYVVSFFILMDVSMPAYDIYGEIEFEYSFRFAGAVRIKGDLSLYMPATTIWNYIYYPIELLMTEL